MYAIFIFHDNVLVQNIVESVSKGQSPLTPIRASFVESGLYLCLVLNLCEVKFVLQLLAQYWGISKYSDPLTH